MHRTNVMWSHIPVKNKNISKKKKPIKNQIWSYEKCSLYKEKRHVNTFFETFFLSASFARIIADKIPRKPFTKLLEKNFFLLFYTGYQFLKATL